MRRRLDTQDRMIRWMPSLALGLVLIADLVASESRLVTNHWRTGGPANPIVDVVVAGTDDEVAFAGARDGDSSALFRTTDSGSTWTLLATAPNGETVRQIAINPTEPWRILALTTGAGVRVYRSDSAGATWRFSRSQPFILGTERIFFDQRRSDTAYFFTGETLWRSNSAGPWTEVLSPFPIASAWAAPNGDLYWSGLFCIGLPCYPRSNRVKAILRSDDTGNTWEEWFTAPCLQMDVVAYADPEIGFASGPDCPKLLRTSDGGGTWIEWDPSGDLAAIIAAGDAPRITQLAVDGQTIYALLESAVHLEAGRIVGTHDGGRSWFELPTPEPVTAMALSPSGRFLNIGTFHGVFRTAVSPVQTLPPRAP